MKKVLLLFVFITVSVILIAQTPQEFKYQAVLRNADGTIMAEESVTILISVLKSDLTTSVFNETHTVTTSAQGVINLNIGSIEDLSTIDWIADEYFLEIEVDGSVMGTTQLLSVPYALHAKTVGSYTETDPAFTAWDKSSGISITESQVSDLDHFTTADETDPEYAAWNKSYHDLTNTPNIIDSINTVMDTITQFVRTELDGDATNEIQDLSLSTNTLSLSGDVTPVDLSSYQNNWEEGSGNVFRQTGDVAIGTNDPLGYKLRVNGTVNVTANVEVGGNVTANGVTFGKIFIINSGIIITTNGDQKQLYWDEINAEIDIVNNSADWCDYWWNTQKGPTMEGNAAAVAPATTQTIISNTNTNDNGFEIHFGQADGVTGWVSIWLQYANGAMVGHFIKY